ncbi:MAG: hypothetical protein Q4B15_03340 [Lachnospiraceae bacterium]|nr:hypothetical protein [Lachnospiraceae bacterium]
MRRGTTPALTIMTGVDLTGAEIYVTFAQNGTVKFEKRETDMTVSEDGTLEMELSQEETISLKNGSVEIQVAYKKDDVVERSNIIAVSVERILKNEEI